MARSQYGGQWTDIRDQKSKTENPLLRKATNGVKRSRRETNLNIH